MNTVYTLHLLLQPFPEGIIPTSNSGLFCKYIDSGPQSNYGYRVFGLNCKLVLNRKILFRQLTLNR